MDLICLACMSSNLFVVRHLPPGGMAWRGAVETLTDTWHTLIECADCGLEQLVHGFHESESYGC